MTRTLGLVVLVVAGVAVAWPVFPRVQQFDVTTSSTTDPVYSAGKGHVWIDLPRGQMKFDVRTVEFHQVNWIDMLNNLTYVRYNDGDCFKSNWYGYDPLAIPSWYNSVAGDAIDGRACDIYAGRAEEPVMWVSVGVPSLVMKTYMRKGDADGMEMFTGHNLGPIDPAVFAHPDNCISFDKVNHPVFRSSHARALRGFPTF